MGTSHLICAKPALIADGRVSTAVSGHPSALSFDLLGVDGAGLSVKHQMVGVEHALLLLRGIIDCKPQAVRYLSETIDPEVLCISVWKLIRTVVSDGQMTRNDVDSLTGYLTDWNAMRRFAITPEDTHRSATAAWDSSRVMTHAALGDLGTHPVSTEELTRPSPAGSPADLHAAALGIGYTLAALVLGELAVRGECLTIFALRHGGAAMFGRNLVDVTVAPERASQYAEAA